MKISKVENKKQFDQFIHFPWKIYPKESPWVPPLIMDVKEILSEKKNPFWIHAKKQLFLAYDDIGQVSGRIAAIVDDNYIKFQYDNCGFFGYFECIDDVQTAKALYTAAKAWLNEQGVPKMMGPMNPSTNDECGFVSEGFDIPPSLMMTYTPEYYLKLAEASGLKKIKELYAYDMDVSADSRVGRLGRVVEMARKKLPGLKVRSMQKNSFKEDLKDAIYIYNNAWEKNWGFVPWTDEEFAYVAKKIKMLIDPEMVYIATMDDKPVGMLISLPDYNQVLKKLDGKLLPFGIFKFLYYKNKIDALRLMVMGVLKDYRQKGVEAIMYAKGLDNALRLGYKHCELSWILEDNVMTNRTAEMMNGKVYKKYRIYGDFDA